MSRFNLTNVLALANRDEHSFMVLIGAFMGISIVFMGMVSLLILNHKATKGYVLNQLESERQELTVDSEVTDTMILRAESLTTVEAHALGMVKPDRTEITFVLPITAVAQR